VRVLVVDDDEDIRESTVMLLEAYGHDVAAEKDAGRVFARVEEFRPDVVLQDVNMPGLEMRLHLEGLARLSPGLPVVLFTASVQLDEVRGLPGVAFVVSKPFEAEDLEDTLEAAVAGYRAAAGTP